MVEVAALVAGWFTPTSLFVLLNVVVATILFTSAYGNGKATHQEKRKPHDHPETRSDPQLFRAPSLFSRVTSFNLNRYYYHQSYSDHYEARHDRPDFPAAPMTPPAFSRSPSFLSRVASFATYRAQAHPEPAQHATVAQEAVADDGRRASEDQVGDRQSREEEKNAAGGGESREEEKVTMTEKEEAEDDEKQAEANMKEEAAAAAAPVRKLRNNINNNKKGGKKTKPVAAPRSRTMPFKNTDEEVDGGKKTKAVATARSKTVSTDEEVDAKADDFINKFKHQLKMQRLESLLRHQSC